MKRHLVTILIATSSLLGSACIDGTDAPPDDQNQGLEEPALDAGDISQWKAAEAEGAPSGTVFVAESPDISVAAAYTCPSGFACLYQNSNLGGFAVAVQSGIGVRNLKGVSCSSCTNGTHGNSGTFNDQMTSWENLSGRQYCWWFDAGPAGERHVMKNNFVVRQVLSRENDRASAFGPCT